MTEVTYRIVSLGDAADAKYPEPRYFSWDEPRHTWDGWRWDSAVYRFEDEAPVECIGLDGGEPEDQTLRRDWKWVASALQAAYELGRTHG